MSTVKTEREAAFWCVAPIAVIKDRRISNGAKLLYCLVTALQTEKGYCYASNQYLADGIGVDSDRTIQRLLLELSKAGYFTIEVVRDERNTVVERRIYPTVKTPELATPPDENDATPPDKNVATPPDKNVAYNRKDNNILPPKAPQGGRKRGEGKKEPKKQPDHKRDRFEKFWRFYPRKESKQAAIKAWDKLEPSDELIDEMAKALKRQMQTEEWTRGIGIPYASTWLNNARWEDELPEQQEEDYTPRQEYIIGGGWGDES